MWHLINKLPVILWSIPYFSASAAFCRHTWHFINLLIIFIMNWFSLLNIVIFVSHIFNWRTEARPALWNLWIHLLLDYKAARGFAATWRGFAARVSRGFATGSQGRGPRQGPRLAATHGRGHIRTTINIEMHQHVFDIATTALDVNSNILSYHTPSSHYNFDKNIII